MENYTEIKKILKWLKGRDHNNTDPTKLLQILNITDPSRKRGTYFLTYNANDDLRKIEYNKDRMGKVGKISYFNPNIEWFKSKGIIYEIKNGITTPVTVIPLNIIQTGITSFSKTVSGYHKMDKQLLDLDIVVREIKLILKQINVELI